jgi:uncharacterized membrane protein SpoIIM required for sporulation
MRRELVLPSAEFRRERESTWRRLEQVLGRAERVGTRRLEGSDLVLLPLLHRAAASSLSVARAISLDKNLLDHLEALCQRAHLCVYGVRRPFRETLVDFFTWRFPAMVRRFRVHLLFAVATMVFGAVVGWVITAADSERFYSLVDPGMAQGRDPDASTEALRRGLYDGGEHASGELGFFASFLFTHNVRVSLLVASLGFLAGVPTFVLLFLNGLTLGAFGALFASRGLGWDFWGWVLPHGVTELLAVALAGAAGFAIAEGLAFPGRRTRRDALARRGREGGTVLVGVVLMLLLAGLLEGFFRQLVTVPVARWTVASLTAAAWTWYLGFAGRGRSR